MIKSNHALILNRLHQMQQAPYYATAKEELALAEQTILDLEANNKRLMEDVVVQTRKIEEFLNKEAQFKVLEEELLKACECIPEAVDLIPRLKHYFKVRKL